LAAEEVAYRDHEQRRVVLGAQRQQLSKRRVAGVAHVLRQRFERLPLGLELLLRIAKASKVARVLGERLCVQTACGKQSLLAGLAQLAHGEGTELRAVRRQPGQRRDIEEGLDLLAEALFVAARQRQLDLVPPRLAGQRDLQRLPGIVVGASQGVGKALAVVRGALAGVSEALAEETGDRVTERSAGDEAECLAGTLDNLLERERGELLEYGHRCASWVGRLRRGEPRLDEARAERHAGTLNHISCRGTENCHERFIVPLSRRSAG